MKILKKLRRPTLSECMRHLILAWLIAATMEYLPLSSALRDLTIRDGLAAMSFSRLLTHTILGALLFYVLSCTCMKAAVERWLMVGVFVLLTVNTMPSSETDAYVKLCCLVIFLLSVYALFGSNKKESQPQPPEKHQWPYLIPVTLLAVTFTVFVSVWTVSRILTFSTPTFDFTIFAQMFHNMSTIGEPLTTVEREVGELSHFAVHVSPTYYLLLPFYMIVPQPATLQVLQAMVIASAVIPMWLIGRHHGLNGFTRMLLCALLLVIPTMAGGTSYDIHENCFLAPLVLWLLYGLDRNSIPITAVAAVLTLGVKEDAAVYVAVVALYALLRTCLHFDKSRLKALALSFGTLVLALCWFAMATGYLEEHGMGVMSTRYNNFIFDGSGSLFTVIIAVLLSPMKMLRECVDEQKITFIIQTFIPLLGMPLMTRKYERFILLIPYILVNLMTDYVYQYDIFFQYTFGSVALLLYLTAINMADLKLTLPELKLPQKYKAFMEKFHVKKLLSQLPRVALLITSIVLLGNIFAETVVPKAAYYPQHNNQYADYYDEMRQALDTIPEDASVGASCFYTTYLSQRRTLYDIQYSTKENLLTAEYIVLNPGRDADYKKYATSGSNGYRNLVDLMTKEGYELQTTFGTRLEIYKKVK